MREWLTRTTWLLKHEGFEEQELAAAVNGMMHDALTFFDRKERAKFDEKLKTLQESLFAA